MNMFDFILNRKLSGLKVELKKARKIANLRWEITKETSA